MKILFAAVLALLATGVRAEIAVQLAAPEPIQNSGAELTADLVVLNTGAQAEDVDLPAELGARLLDDSRSWPVQLRSTEGAARITVAAGGFFRRSYRFTLPDNLNGRFVLEITQPAPARAAIEARDFSNASVEGRLGRNAPPPVSRIERSFASRFLFHEPIYFIYGPEAPSAKFQFSFKYRLIGGDSAFGGATPSPRGFYLAYTQRSLWDVEAESSPFYDTSYMPELFFEWLAPEFGRTDGWFHWLGFQTGTQHESNGQDGDASRSLNIAYLRSGVALGRLDGWRILIVPKLFAYIDKSSDNSDIARYRGYDDLLLAIGKNDGPQLSLTTRVGKSADKGSLQVDLTQPVRVPWIGLETYLQLQYFTGYGESLRYYNEKTSVWRLGMGFVR